MLNRKALERRQYSSDQCIKNSVVAIPLGGMRETGIREIEINIQACSIHYCSHTRRRTHLGAQRLREPSIGHPQVALHELNDGLGEAEVLCLGLYVCC